jgi:hypothetical protein
MTDRERTDTPRLLLARWADDQPDGRSGWLDAQAVPA